MVDAVPGAACLAQKCVATALSVAAHTDAIVHDAVAWGPAWDEVTVGCVARNKTAAVVRTDQEVGIGAVGCRGEDFRYE